MLVKKVLNGQILYFRYFVDGDIVLTSNKEKAFNYQDNARGRAFAEEVSEIIEGEIDNEVEDNKLADLKNQNNEDQ